jgi:hypothetical protein
MLKRMKRSHIFYFLPPLKLTLNFYISVYEKFDVKVSDNYEDNIKSEKEEKSEKQFLRSLSVYRTLNF